MDKLYFGNLLIGHIFHSGDDFPWSHGEFHLRFDTSDPISTHITKYISHSIRVSDFYMEQTEFNLRPDLEDQLAKEAIEFNDLIYSDQWKIIHLNDEVTKILIPVFHSDGSIGWRLA